MSCRKLEVRNLVVELISGSSRRLVDNLSLTVAGGGSLALVGESGAGKSMTSLAILDLLPKGLQRTSGEIIVNDRVVSGMTQEEKRLLRCRELGMIMQSPMSAFDPVFTVLSHFAETVAAGGEGRLSSKQLRCKAAAAVKEVGLEEAVLDAYPFQLSGGMLQRIMIALALIHDPDYLIADEPTTDLDVVAQKKVLDLIRERCRARHLGLLIITHDLSVARYMADSVAIMVNGAVVENGFVRNVFSSPNHPYARELIESHSRLYGKRFVRLAQAGGWDGGIRHYT